VKNRHYTVQRCIRTKGHQAGLLLPNTVHILSEIWLRSPDYLLWDKFTIFVTAIYCVVFALFFCTQWSES